MKPHERFCVWFEVERKIYNGNCEISCLCLQHNVQHFSSDAERSQSYCFNIFILFLSLQYYTVLDFSLFPLTEKQQILIFIFARTKNDPPSYVSGKTAIVYNDDDIDIISATHSIVVEAFHSFRWDRRAIRVCSMAAKIVSSIMHQTLNIFVELMTLYFFSCARADFSSEKQSVFWAVKTSSHRGIENEMEFLIVLQLIWFKSQRSLLLKKAVKIFRSFIFRFIPQKKSISKEK